MRALSVIIILFLANFSFAMEQPKMVFPNIEINGEEKAISKLVFSTNYSDLGEVVFGEKYIHVFEFVNEGNATLLVEEAFAENDHAEVFSFSPIVEPGEKGWVRVSFLSEFSIGKFSEHFYVRSNSGGKKSLSRLKIQYELFEYLAIGGDNIEELDQVNIREQPLLDSPVMYQLAKGEICKILGDDIGDYVEKFDDSFWFKIESEGRVGWVLSALTEF